MSLLEAIAAPRATQRHTTAVIAEAAYRDLYETVLAALGHVLAGTSEIGATTGLEFLPDGRLFAAAEPVRRGGGDAGLLRADS